MLFKKVVQSFDILFAIPHQINIFDTSFTKNSEKRKPLILGVFKRPRVKTLGTEKGAFASSSFLPSSCK